MSEAVLINYVGVAGVGSNLNIITLIMIMVMIMMMIMMMVMMIPQLSFAYGVLAFNNQNHDDRPPKKMSPKVPQGSPRFPKPQSQ